MSRFVPRRAVWTRALMLGLGLWLCACATAPKPVRPQVAAVGETAASFWTERVQYPYPVKVSTQLDEVGRKWQLTYMDEGSGNNVIVLLHGRGANAGYFSGLMAELVAAGMRVIAIDVPLYGKSLELNPLPPLTRSLTEARRLIYQLLRDDLGINRYALLGHSLGGQLAIGMALANPSEVTTLILESSHGLEEFPTHFPIENGRVLPLFDPQQNYSMANWRKVWGPLGFIEEQTKLTREDIDTIYFHYRIDPNTKQRLGHTGPLYLNKSPDALYMRDLRVAMIQGDPLNFGRYITVYTRDLYSMGVETRLEDPESLAKRLPELSMPVLMAFGGRDDYLPLTAFSGNRTILNDLAMPVYLGMLAQNRKVQIVNYPDSGHVIHADATKPFARDVTQFIKLRKTATKPVSFVGQQLSD